MQGKELISLIPIFYELRGEKVVVRPYRAEDAQNTYDAINESRGHLRPWMPWAEGHRTPDETRDWIAHVMAKFITREDLTLGIWERAGDSEGRYLGGTGLHPHDWQTRFFEIGYWIRVDAEGRGYVTEAVSLLTEYALQELKANRLLIRCDERNTRSAAIPRRLGYVFEGCLRNSMTAPDGSLRNTLVFSRIPGDRS